MALAAAGLAAPFQSWPAASQNSGDRGIGGTGFAPASGSDDRGIGGTGFVGTIQRFGSIIVNDQRISYSPSASVTIDGRKASARELRLGQVVSVAAERTLQGELRTSEIAVSHEVVGQIRSVSSSTLNILNQRIDTSLLDARSFRPGMRVAVSGLRRLDGSIVASLVETARPGADRIAGLVEADENGLWIDGLKLRDADRAWIGRRVVLTGHPTSSGFAATSGMVEALPVARGVSRLSVEAYLRREYDQLRLGSGLTVPGSAAMGDLELGSIAKAFVELSIDSTGQFSLTAIRLENGGSQGSGGPGGPGAPGSGIGSPAGPGGGGRSGGPGSGGFGGGPGGGGLGGGPAGNGPGGSGPGGAGPGGGGPGGNGPGGGAGGGGAGGGGGGPR